MFKYLAFLLPLFLCLCVGAQDSQPTPPPTQPPTTQPPTEPPTTEPPTQPPTEPPTTEPPTEPTTTVGYVNATDDLKQKIEELVADGCKTIHIMGPQYNLTVPIILETGELEIFGHGVIINRDFWRLSNGPIIIDICRKLRVTGCVFNVLRPEVWKSYVPMVKFHVSDGEARRQNYEGPRYKYIEEFVFENNKIIDTNEKTKANSGLDQYGKRDQWVIVSNLRLGGNSLIVKNNRLEVPDMELTGGNWGWDSVVLDGNHIWGGRTTGAYLDLLSRYYGDIPRRYRSVVITNNVVYNLHNNMIALGYDAKTTANTQFDIIRVENNIGYLTPDCSKTPKMFLFKSREFRGTMIVRKNLLDGTAIPFDRKDVEPTDILATNFKWGPDRTHITQPAGTGIIHYEQSRGFQPANAVWSFHDGIRRSHFATVIKRARH